jgi:S-DNA-T family DNA segregation ATPase FtsK/SpoIIIE
MIWTLSVRPSRESRLAPVDVVVRAQPKATVSDLAAALGRHLNPAHSGLLVVPTESGVLWPADRVLAECGLRTGAVLDVVTAPGSWHERPGVPARRRAMLRVVSGPDAGLVVPLTGESATIGRSDECTVTLTDPLVSRRHARVLLTPAPIVLDEGSAGGTTISGSSIRRPTPVDWGGAIEVGSTVVVLEAAENHQDSSGVGVLRPPRFGEPLAEDEVEISAPPTLNKPHPPWAMLAMPLVFGSSMFFTGNWIFGLIYVLAWPLAMLVGFRFEGRMYKKQFRKDVELWRETVDAKLAEIDRHAAVQRRDAVTDQPPLPALPQRVLTRHRTLWARRDSDPDYMACRIGLGPVPALLTGKLTDGGEREPAVEAQKELDLRRTLPDMPIAVPVAQAGLAAIVGPRDQVDAVARALILRLCCDHSPADLSVAAVLSRPAGHHETWLRWLPQVRRLVGGTAPVAVGAADGQMLLDQLATSDSGHGLTVCVVDANAGLSRRAVEAVAVVAAERRLRLIWLGDSPDTVPSNTDIMIDLTNSVHTDLVTAARTLPDQPPPQPVAQLARRDRGGVELVTSLDTVELGTAWKVARAMTDYTDEAAVLPADTALPELVRLPEVAGDLANADDETAVLERWSAARGLRGQIGAGVDGPVTLDLRDDGPHGLVAGTTGSGKSELLQTLICSLALNNPPSRITFLLVDYKGGAAFRECADLPHTVGYITDLTPALVKRALTSLTAEVNYREELLAEYGAKDLIALEREHLDIAPPALLICVDEFAALTAEVPDFVDGMVNIAQRGRSLGMHMLLATQRPAGVVTPQIRANTDLRIALRVASPDDSQDVLDRPDAARISRRTPGRAWIRRTGHGTDELVQAAWVGAREELRSAGQLVDVLPFSAQELKGDKGYDRAADAPVKLHPRSDLERLVTTIGGAFVRSGCPKPKLPWLPALPSELLLGCATPGELLLGTGVIDEESVPGAANDVRTVPGDAGHVPLGLSDVPRRQAQPPLVLDYTAAGHVLVYGTSGSGKTELLHTIAVAATLAGSDRAPYVYVIDYAGGGLSSLENWPSVGSVVSERQPERVLRMLRMLRRTVNERNAMLASSGAADLETLALPRIHVLIDNFPALTDALEGNGPIYRQHNEILGMVLQEGRRVGVHVTATSAYRGGVLGAMQSNFGERLVLRMTTDDDYMMLGAANGVVTADSPPGRGMLGRTEVQIGTVGGVGTPMRVQRMNTLAELVRHWYTGKPPVQVPGMPSRLPQTVVPAPDRDSMVLGVDADTVTAVTARLGDGPILLTGRSRSGRSSVLAGIATLARRSTTPPSQVVLLGPNATEQPDKYDLVLNDLGAIATWLPDWTATRPSGWSLLLIDDAHIWERAADAGGEAQNIYAALADVITAGAGPDLAVVVATDPDESRSRQFVKGPVQAARAGRRGILLQPEFADGTLLGATLPSNTIEPLTGASRGLWCTGGNAQVVHVVSAPPNGSE